MSGNLNDRVLTELGRAPTTGLTRGELAILMLDVDDDLVTKAVDQLRASGQVAMTRRDGPFGRLLRYHPNPAADLAPDGSTHGDHERSACVARRVVPRLRSSPGLALQSLAVVAQAPSPALNDALRTGWRGLRCPTCKSLPQEPCRTPSGREASRIHAARLRRGRSELAGLWSVWEELAQRSATIALVEFSGRAGRGGQTGAITLCRREGNELVDAERWTFGRDELSYALEAPVWGRYGRFTGHPSVRGTVTWIVPDRSVVIAGQRGDARFEETIA